MKEVNVNRDREQERRVQSQTQGAAKASTTCGYWSGRQKYEAAIHMRSESVTETVEQTLGAYEASR